MIFTKEFSVRKILLYGIFLAALICIPGSCLVLGIKVWQATCDHVFALSFSQESQSFGDSDISSAQKEGINLTYVKRLYPEISNGFRTEETEVMATNDNYAYFVSLELRGGTFFNQKQVEHELAVAVLNETAAYQLFGNYDCIGETVYLDQNGFEVIGIVKENGSEEVSRIYISDKVAERLDMSCSEVDQLWCQFHNAAEAALVIQKMGYSMEEMDIVQMDLYKTVFMQRFLIVPVMLGVAFLIYTLKALRNRIKIFMQENVADRKELVKCGLLILLCAGIFLLTVKMIQLFWCVPPNYELIGKSFGDGFYTILEFYSLSDMELDNMLFLSKWNMLSMLLSICSVFGVGMFCMGIQGRIRAMQYKQNGNSFKFLRRTLW